LIKKFIIVKLSKYILQSLNSKQINTIMGKTKLTINRNGSLKIEGDFEIVDQDGNVYGLQGRETLGLCRCGLSANKPFCDGSHRNGFEHDAKAFDLPPMKTK
jgi:CDGSH-type Zn-finger protein